MPRGKRPGQGEKRRRRSRRLLVVVAALVALELAYVGLAGLFLTTGLAASLINRDPRRLELGWGAARSWVPGLVRLEDVTIRGQNRDIQWHASLDRASVAVRLFSLARKELRAPRVRGMGLRLRLRTIGEGGESRAAPEPPIPDLTRAPPEPANREQARSGRWRIDLEDVVIDRVEEIWIEEERLTGRGSLTASVELQVGGELEIPHAALDSSDGVLRRGERELARDVRLHLEISSRPFVPRRLQGAEFLGNFSGALSLAADVKSVSVFDRLLVKAPWLSLDGAGQLEAELTVEGGEVEAGSRLRLQATPVVARFLDYRAQGSGELLLEAPLDAEPEGVLLTARFDDYTLRRTTAERPHVRGRGLEVRALGSSLDLVDGFGDLRVVVDLPASEVDFLFYDRYLPRKSPLRLTRGDGTLRGRLEYSAAETTGKGEIELTVDRAEARFGEVDLQGRLSLSAQLRDGDFEERRFDIAGTRLHISDATVRDSAEREPREAGWWGRIDLPRARMELKEPLWLDASFAARLKSSAPFMALLAERSRALDWLGRLITVEDVRGSGRVILGEDTVRVEGVDIRGGRESDKLEILGDMVFDGPLESGVLFARYGRFSAALEVEEGRRDWKLVGARKWFQRRRSR